MFAGESFRENSAELIVSDFLLNEVLGRDALLFVANLISNFLNELGVELAGVLIVNNSISGVEFSEVELLSFLGDGSWVEFSESIDFSFEGSSAFIGVEVVLREGVGGGFIVFLGV